MKKLFLIFLLLLELLSCKNNEKKLDGIVPDNFGVIFNDSIIGEDRFKIIVNAVVQENDKFQLYYKDNQYNEFSTERMIESIVNGNNKPQEIVYTLAPEIIPTHFRLDFGTNYSQKPIKLNFITIRYGNNEYIFDNEKFAQLFKGNRYTKFKVGSKEIHSKVINNSYDPHYISINLEEITFELIE